MRSYGVVQFAVKDYMPSAVAPAADVHAYPDDRRVTCGVLYIYAHHRVSSAKPLRAYSQTVYSAFSDFILPLYDIVKPKSYYSFPNLWYNKTGAVDF